MATPAHIKNFAQGIHASAPRLTTGTPLGLTLLRDQLEELACVCGLPEKVAANATDNDLISIYLVALKDGAGGERVAQRINLRTNAPKDILDGPNPDWKPATWTPPKRKEPRTHDTSKPFDTVAPEFPPPTYYDEDFKPPRQKTYPEQPPKRDLMTQPELEALYRSSAPKEATGPSLDAVRDLIKREVREGALEPLQTAIGKVHDDLLEEIARVPLDAAEASLAAMRAELATAAHSAALEAIKTLTPTRLEITRPDKPEPVDIGLVHKKTPQVIAALSAGVNVYLYGPAGSGKTTLAEKVAQAFGCVAYYAAKVESEYQLLGFKDAKGDTVRTQFREAYEHGGVFLFDELDGSSPSAVVALNMALANGLCPFPDGMVKRHKDFKCIAAGNTKLTGATRQYAGRNQLDAASIDRFAFIEFGYDDDLELALAADQSWAKYVQRVRAVVAARGLDHLVTPRATYAGCDLLAAGMDRETVAAMVIYKGLDADTVRQIEAAL